MSLRVIVAGTSTSASVPVTELPPFNIVGVNLKSLELITTFTEEQSTTPELQVQAAGLVTMLVDGVAATSILAPLGEHVPIFESKGWGLGLGLNVKLGVSSTNRLMFRMS